MKVLVIDDDELLRSTAATMLEAAGFEVTQAGDGREGVREFCRAPADTVLCDMFMPNRDGLELIREFRRDFPGVPIVAMSGGGYGGTLDVLGLAPFLGADATLPKPFDRGSLLSAVGEVTSRRRVTRLGTVRSDGEAGEARGEGDGRTR